MLLPRWLTRFCCQAVVDDLFLPLDLTLALSACNKQLNIGSVGTLMASQIHFWMLRAPDGDAKNFSIRLLTGEDNRCHLTNCTT